MAIVWRAEFLEGEILKVVPVPRLNNSYTPPPCPSGDKPFDNCICDFTVRYISSSSTPFSEYSQLTTFPLQERVPVPLSCVIGQTAITPLDRLIEICLTKLTAGEGTMFMVDYNSDAHSQLDIKLNSFKIATELCEMSGEALCALASQLKEEGRGHFAAKRFVPAFYKFSRGLKSAILIDEMKCSANIQEERRELISSLCNNLAACHLQKGNKCNWMSVIELCSKALDFTPSNVKALYRRGVALLEIEEFEKARDDLQKAKDLDPTNEAIPAKLAVLTQKENAFNQKYYGSGMRKMFSS